MSKGNTFENDIMKLVLNGTPIPNIADNAATLPLTDLFLGLYIADPGEAGDQTTNEVSYGSYARVAIARTSGGWTVTGNTGVNVGTVDFPACTSGSATVTHAVLGTASSGTGKILYKGALGSSLPVSSGTIPRFTAGTITLTED